MARRQFHADTGLPCRAVTIESQLETESGMPHEIQILKHPKRRPDPTKSGKPAAWPLIRGFPPCKGAS